MTILQTRKKTKMSSHLTNTILFNQSIKDGLKQLDTTAKKLLLVVSESGHLLGTLSDGDIRRALLRGCELNATLDGVYNANCISLNINDFNTQTAISICTEKLITGIPIVTDTHEIVDFFDHQRPIHSLKLSHNKLDIPVVIMGGGKGTRMKPLSDIFPKPLIPINGKAMISHVMDFFEQYGIQSFFITLNYKSHLMIAYCDSLETTYNIEYAIESSFMGTAGGLSLIENQLPQTFIISNCDALAKTDISALVNDHHEKQAVLTVVCSIQHHQIPYGRVHYENGGKIRSIEEKPELSMAINTGVYVADKRALAYIDPTRVFHMTDLIQTLIDQGLPVHCYLINEKEFIDFGQWDAYKQASNLLNDD